MTTVQPLSSWVVVTVRVRPPELVLEEAVACPPPPDQEDTLTADDAAPLADAAAARPG